MGRSKIEIYIAILEALVTNGAMRPNKITCETSINYSLVKKAVLDLQNKQLVEEKKINKGHAYAATPKGKFTLSQFKELSKYLPVFEIIA